MNMEKTTERYPIRYYSMITMAENIKQLALANLENLKKNG